MSACPACGRDVRPVWPTCRACGALLIPAPAPLVREPATAAAPGPPAPTAEEQFYAPAVLHAPVTAAAPPPPGAPPATRRSGPRGIAAAGIGVFLLATVALAWFALKPAPAAHHDVPVALAPRAASTGLPTGLSDIVRIEAESTRRAALQAVEYVGNGTPAALQRVQPSFTWVAGTTASKGPKDVSVSADTAGTVTVAVAGSNHDICAFGEWSRTTPAPVYVTMAHEPECAAVDAPPSGWSTVAGGAGSDLPDDPTG